MTKSIRHWRNAEREALRKLDAAKTNSALKAAARELMRARRMLLWLTDQPAEA